MHWRTLTGVSVVPLLAVGLSACAPYEPSSSEKAICVTMDDLNTLGFDADINSAAEKWVGIRTVGKRQLLYNYEYSVRDGKGRVFLQCEATTQLTSVEAMTTYRVSLLTAKAIAMGDVEERRSADGNCSGADACRLIGLYFKNEPVGSHFAVRSGRKVIAVTLVGAHFDDVAEWRDVVADKVKLMQQVDET